MKKEISKRIVAISELKLGMKNIRLLFKVLGKSETRRMQTFRGSVHRVAEAIVGDNTGIVRLLLWDESITRINKGKTYLVGSCKTHLFKGYLRVSVSARSSYIIDADTPITNINHQIDMSDKKHGTL